MQPHLLLSYNINECVFYIPNKMYNYVYNIVSAEIHTEVYFGDHVNSIKLFFSLLILTKQDNNLTDQVYFWVKRLGRKFYYTLKNQIHVDGTPLFRAVSKYGSFLRARLGLSNSEMPSLGLLWHVSPKCLIGVEQKIPRNPETSRHN